MKCPKCHFENPEASNFCHGCAEKIELACPNCGEFMPRAAKYCNECRHDLASLTDPSPKALSPDEQLDKIQRYLPKGLAEKILAQTDKIEGEKRVVTIMLVDMMGFTPLTETLGAVNYLGDVVEIVK